MSALEDRVRAELHGYADTAVPGHRPLTSWEEKLPASVKEPYGPDVTVFGDPRGPAEHGESHGWPFIACPVHQVGWWGPEPCWCCADGVKPA